MRSMKWTAISLALISVACAGRSWQQVPAVGNLSAPQSCTANLAAIWTDSLPLVDDTALQHIVAGDIADYYPADLKLETRSGRVRARFAIDTLGRGTHPCSFYLRGQVARVRLRTMARAGAPSWPRTLSGSTIRS